MVKYSYHYCMLYIKVAKEVNHKSFHHKEKISFSSSSFFLIYMGWWIFTKLFEVIISWFKSSGSTIHLKLTQCCYQLYLNKTVREKVKIQLCLKKMYISSDKCPHVAGPPCRMDREHFQVIYDSVRWYCSRLWSSPYSICPLITIDVWLHCIVF